MEQPFVADNLTQALSRNIDDYPGGIIVPVDKPYRWTSADVIRKVKFAAVRHFGKKNLKVGHAGTLDPLATGVLLVCIGNATKLAESLQAHDKEYIAGVSFGATTPSYDLEKDIDREFPYEHITEAALREALQGFVGEQEQIAPLFSAKSVDGVRVYEIARKLYKQQMRSGQVGGLGCVEAGGSGGGQASVEAGGSGCGRVSVEASSLASGQAGGSESGSAGAAVFDATASGLIRASRITISEAELLAFYPAGTYRRPESAPTAAPAAASSAAKAASTASKRINVADTSSRGLPHADIRLSCSKGTYIRAFARDLGEALDSGAHLDALQRSRSGDFHVSRALPLDRVIALLTD